jgi:catechol 2,3-dioxygenase-like lactoylglutathione lyase family enzyme
MLSTRDLARTIEFYTGVLGFALAMRWPETEPAIAILTHGPVELAFTRAEDDAPPQLTGQLSFEVADARALFERLKDQVEILWGMEVYHYGRREFSFRDPNGYALVVSEPTDDPVTCREA